MTIENDNIEASLSTLIMSIGSSAAMSLGLSPDPATGKTSVNKEVARFNIDLLKVIEEKTKNNLSTEEENFLKHIISDLQLKFVELK
ncbi:MAG: DUF1844 domain-containing protein [Bdellovibrionales bacterium]